MRVAKPLNAGFSWRSTHPMGRSPDRGDPPIRQRGREIAAKDFGPHDITTKFAPVFDPGRKAWARTRSWQMSARRGRTTLRPLALRNAAGTMIQRRTTTVAPIRTRS